MIYCQTFATDLLEHANYDALNKMLAVHYLSALTISKQLRKGDEFILITDSKGKEFCKNFPYHKIVTALNKYPHVRPYQMSAYKLYSIQVFKNKTFVHFDNDVFLFKRIPKFKDTIVQSCEEIFAHTTYTNKIQYFDWKFPNYVKDIVKNYNPGIFGFTSSSVVRDDYFDIFLEYSEKNIEFINNEEGIIKRKNHQNEMQDIYMILEEGLLWYLCNKKKADVIEFIPNKYKEYNDIWGKFSKGKYRGVDWGLIQYVCYRKWREQKYIHLMNYHNLIGNYENVGIPQGVFLEIYKLYKNDVEKMLNNKIWKL